MSDMKSKLPDLKELASMTGKLFTDIKTSVTQIIQDYKDVRVQTGESVKVPEKKTEAKAEKAKAAKEEPKE